MEVRVTPIFNRRDVKRAIRRKYLKLHSTQTEITSHKDGTTV